MAKTREAISEFLRNKVILLTGGTGSFGRHFTKVLLERFNFKALRIYSRDEVKQQEMRAELDHERIRYFIGDIRDPDRLSRAMEGVDVVVHAAAMKQVPACEYNPFEAVKTNILGAQHVIDTAIDNQVRQVIALSTDKAVSPANLYGATKHCAEKMFVQGNSYAGGRATRFSCVRYGNVLGSRGSVVPLFLEQRRHGVLTVTDTDMTRFWLTLEQAVQFVLGRLTSMHGGEIFVPRIPSMRIVHLAEAIAPECAIQCVGIRPGEKLHESLIAEDESRHTLEYDHLFTIVPEYADWGRQNGRDGKPLPPGFRYRSDTNDWWLSVEQLRTMLSDQGRQENGETSNGQYRRRATDDSLRPAVVG